MLLPMSLVEKSLEKYTSCGLPARTSFPQSLSNAILPELLVDCIHKEFSPSCRQVVIQLHLAICQGLDILPAFILNIGIAQQSFIEHPWWHSCRNVFHNVLVDSPTQDLLMLWIYRWSCRYTYDNPFPIYWYYSADF